MLSNVKETPSAARFARIIFFVNPKSTHVTIARKRMKEITALLPNASLLTIETSTSGPQATAKLIESCAGELGPRTLICIGAGDGTTNQIVQALLISAALPETARKSPILPLWGGNANDLACMLNGPSFRMRTSDLLKKGKIIPIHPLECTLVTKKKDKRVHIAACYAGFGTSAFVAKQLNLPTHRQSRLLRIPGGRILQEIMTVVGAIMEAPGFTVQDPDSVKVVYERLFSNGPRMAKVKRLPVQLTDEMFYLNTLEDKRLVSAIPRIIESTSKRLSQKFLGNYATFTTKEKSWAQFDGEALEIPAHTKVQVQLSGRPFYAFSAALQAPPQSKTIGPQHKPQK